MGMENFSGFGSKKTENKEENKNIIMGGEIKVGDKIVDPDHPEDTLEVFEVSDAGSDYKELRVRNQRGVTLSLSVHKEGKYEKK